MRKKIIFNQAIMRYILIALISSIQILTFAQEGSSLNIAGIATNAISGEPVYQVLISVSGTSTSSTSDENGKFEIKDIPTNAMLIAKHPDFVTKEIYIHGRENLDLKLVPAGYKSIDDVVVTPNGDKKAKKIPMSYSYFSKSDVKNTGEASFARDIQGKATGLQVKTLSGMPGALSTFSVRGPSSITGRNDPVVIIDGVLHELHYANQSAIEGFIHNPLEMVDNDDIESITIMKDAQSYLGSLGANGVIVINTEEKNEASSAIRVHAYEGFITPSTKMSLMDAGKFNSYMNDLLATSSMTQKEINAQFPYLANGTDPLYANNTDWQDEIFTSGLISKYHIFLKGGDKIGNLNMSTGFLRHKGIIQNTSYSRFNLRINSKINISNKFSFIPNVKLSTSDSYLMEQGPSDITNPILAANLIPPITRPYLVDGTTSDQYINDVGAFQVSNPVAITNYLTAQNKNYQFMASGKARYAFTDKLAASTNVSLSYNRSSDNLFIPDKGLLEMDSARNYMKAMVTEFRSFQNNVMINYAAITSKNSNLDFRLGNRILRSIYEYDMGVDLNSATDDFRSLGSGSEDSYLRQTTGSYRTLNYVSLYSTADYAFQDKYYLNVSLAYDGNSVIHENNRYNLYYSVAGAWDLTSGNASMSTRFDQFKLRTSYGTSGNIFNSIYDYSRLFYVGKRLTDVGVLVRESIPNVDMEVEEKTTINIGLDLSSAGQNFNASVDLFYATVNNLIISQKISAAYGYPVIYNNAGEMASQGIELSADYRFKTGQSYWTVGITGSSVINNITSLDQNLAEGEENYILTPIDDTQNSDVNLISEIGEPLYCFFGYETDGVFSNENEANALVGPNGSGMHVGDIKFIDQDNNGIIDENDKTNIGNPQPLVYGAFFTSYRKGRVKATANFGYSVGNKIYNYVAMRTNSMDDFYNQNENAVDRWTQSNASSDVPRAAYGDPSGNSIFSDRWIEDGSYIRIKNITVSYDFPTKNKFFKNLEVYLTGSNLLTLTKYSGYDPEFNYVNNMIYTGIDFGKIPFGRSVILGVNLEL